MCSTVFMKKRKFIDGYNFKLISIHLYLHFLGFIKCLEVFDYNRYNFSVYIDIYNSFQKEC